MRPLYFPIIWSASLQEFLPLSFIRFRKELYRKDFAIIICLIWDPDQVSPLPGICLLCATSKNGKGENKSTQPLFYFILIWWIYRYWVDYTVVFPTASLQPSYLPSSSHRIGVNALWSVSGETQHWCFLVQGIYLVYLYQLSQTCRKKSR